MVGLTTRKLSVFTTIAFVALEGCAGNVREQRIATATAPSCSGRVTMTVLNNTQQLVGVYELGGQGRQVFVGGVPAGGVLQVPAVKGEARYGARGGRGTNSAWVAMTESAAIANGAGVQLMRGCDTTS